MQIIYLYIFQSSDKEETNDNNKIKKKNIINWIYTIKIFYYCLANCKLQKRKRGVVAANNIPLHSLLVIYTLIHKNTR